MRGISINWALFHYERRSTTLRDAVSHMDKALHLYKDGEDALTVERQLIRLHRTLAEARSALIQEQVDAILARPTLDQTDTEILKKLLGLKLFLKNS